MRLPDDGNIVRRKIQVELRLPPDVNGCANPTLSGDAKKAGMVFAASEPGQGRAQPGEANP